ncbi:MAG: transcription elongation factor GreA, partial [Deltaproteobacteria bacterium]
MAADSIPMTKAGADAIKREIKRLKSVERPRIVQEISTARDHGDLSENAEYHAAKEKQSHIEGRIQILEDRLARAEIIDVKRLSGGRVVFGATVRLEDTDSGT